MKINKFSLLFCALAFNYVHISAMHCNNIPIPQDMVAEMFNHLPMASQCNLAATCKKYNESFYHPVARKNTGCIIDTRTALSERALKKIERCIIHGSLTIKGIDQEVCEKVFTSFSKQPFVTELNLIGMPTTEKESMPTTEKESSSTKQKLIIDISHLNKLLAKTPELRSNTYSNLCLKYDTRLDTDAYSPLGEWGKHLCGTTNVTITDCEIQCFSFNWLVQQITQTSKLRKLALKNIDAFGVNSDYYFADQLSVIPLYHKEVKITQHNIRYCHAKDS
jgi:hypothetical protein